MVEAIQLELQPLNRARPTRFTPERMQQVRNLVERGKSSRRDCRDYRCDNRLVASYLLEIGDQPAAPHF